MLSNAFLFSCGDRQSSGGGMGGLFEFKAHTRDVYMSNAAEMRELTDDVMSQERAAPATVYDDRSIQDHLDGGTNWRWNGASELGTSVVVTYDFSSGA